MAPQDSAVQWVGEWSAGRQSAAGRLWERFQPRLAALARRCLGSRAGTWVDEDDLVSQAWGSFFRRARDGDFRELLDANELWRLLAAIVTRKAMDHQRSMGRTKRLPDVAGDPGEFRKVTGAGPFARSSWSPEFRAVRADLLRHLFERLADDELRQIALLKLHGHVNREIARIIGRSEPTVERRLRLIRLVWAQEENA